MPSRKKSHTTPLRVHGQTIEMVPLGDLKPYEKNARLHPEDQLKALEAIIRDSGFTAPLIIDPANSIIAGHGRALVAKRLGMAAVPCVRVTGLTDAQIKALRLSDNQAALRGSWDKDLLLGELTGLMGQGFDLSLTGFADLELGTLGVAGFALEERLAEADEVPDPPKVPRVRLGELWLLGDHRLIIGDSTDAKTVDRLLDGAKPNLMATDPPYGVEYDPNWRNETGIAEDGSLQRLSTGRVRKSIGAKAVGKVSNDHRSDWREAWTLFPGNVAYVWHADRHATSVDLSLQSVGFVMRAQIIWNKMRMIIGRGDYHFSHEPCWYAVRKGKPGEWSGDRKQTTMWDISHRASETGHGTQKPVECMRRPILNNSKPGAFVYDPFCGSGTTVIACEMEGRNCLAIELDPVYAEVIITRWEAFTKKTATREDGATLEDLADTKVARKRLRDIKSGTTKLVTPKRKKAA